MLLGCGFGHQQEDQQGDGLLVRRVKPDRLGQLKHRSHRRLQPLDAPMRDSDTVPESGRPEALPGKQAVGNQGPAEAMKILKQQSRFFKNPLLAAGIDLHHNLCNGEDGRESIHNSGPDYALKKCPMQNGRPRAAAPSQSVGVFLHQPLGSLVMVLLKPPLVPNNLTIEFVHEFVNGRIQISV